MKVVIAVMSALVLAVGCCLGGVLFAKAADKLEQTCGGDLTPAAGQSPVSDYAKKTVPPEMLTIYVNTGRKYPQIDWAVLAGIGFVETTHWTNKATSSAGAMGPMQFLPGTWKEYGQDGNGDGKKDIMNPYDAVAGAANYLRASGGARNNYKDAIWMYNHSEPYYLRVMDMASKYGYVPHSADQPPSPGTSAKGSANDVLAGFNGAGRPATGGPSGAADPCLDGVGLVGTLAQKIVQLARQQVSIPERNHERGGDNCNFYSAANGAGSRCANGYRSEAWCADFVIWVYKTAGASTAGANAAAKSFEDGYGPLHHTWHTSNPLPGDAVVFNFGHVGIVTAVSATDITYVSGNTSDPKGFVDVVAEKTRPRSWAAIDGYASPVPAKDPRQDT